MLMGSLWLSGEWTLGAASGGGETRQLTSVAQVGDGWARAVAGGAFYENCLFMSFAHFLVASCLSY